MKPRADLLSKLCLLIVLLCSATAQAQRIPTERGHWSPPLPMNRDVWHIFHSVIDREGDGVRYSPTSYSLQITNGKRYRFYCRSTVVDAPVQGSALITVFVHLGGQTELVTIQDTTIEKEQKTESGKTSFAGTASVTDRKPKWLSEPLYPRTGPYLQAPRKTVRKL